MFNLAAESGCVSAMYANVTRRRLYEAWLYHRLSVVVVVVIVVVVVDVVAVALPVAAPV